MKQEHFFFFVLAGLGHTPSVSQNNSYFTYRCDSLLSWWADDGNNAQRGSSEEALI